jgi:hypothetical protein
MKFSIGRLRRNDKRKQSARNPASPVPEPQRHIPYVRRRVESYPAREEFFTAAPAVDETKDRLRHAQVRLQMSATPRHSRPVKATTTSPAKGTRTAQILGLVARPTGATLTEIAEATGWQRWALRLILVNSERPSSVWA